MNPNAFASYPQSSNPNYTNQACSSCCSFCPFAVENLIVTATKYQWNDWGSETIC